jgi:hypothetical protein
VSYAVGLCLSVCLFGACNEKSPKAAVLQNFREVNPESVESDVRDFSVAENRPEKIDVREFRAQAPLNLSELFDSITYVRLSSVPGSLIGEINKTVIRDSCIYILDRYKTRSLKKFALNGDFLATVGSCGEGPEEYIEPTDFVLYKDEIIVCDQYKADLKYYDLEGRFKYRKKVPFLFLKFACFAPDRYVFHAIDADNDHLPSIANYSVFQSDSSFVLNARGFFRPKNVYVSFLSENNFSAGKNSLFYHPPFTDTIFSIDADRQLKAEYVIDFQEKKLPQEAVEQKNGRPLETLFRTGRYAVFAGNYVVMEDGLYFEYVVKNMRYRGIYSRKTNKLKVGNMFYNDLKYSMLPFENILTSMEDNMLVGYMPAYDARASYEEADRDKWVKRFGEENTRIIESMADDDNPILIFYKIKAF